MGFTYNICIQPNGRARKILFGKSSDLMVHCNTYVTNTGFFLNIIMQRSSAIINYIRLFSCLRYIDVAWLFRVDLGIQFITIFKKINSQVHIVLITVFDITKSLEIWGSSYYSWQNSYVLVIKKKFIFSFAIVNNIKYHII